MNISRSLALALPLLFLIGCEEQGSSPVEPEGPGILFDKPPHTHGDEDPGDPGPPDPEIVFRSDGAIRVIDASGANETVVFEMTGPINSTSWSPDGSQILFSSAPDPHGISVLDVTIGADGQPLGGVPVTIVPRVPLGFVYPSWSPDGTEIALADGHVSEPPSSLWVANVDGTGLTAIYDAPAGWLVNSSTSWSFDGTRIAFVERLEDFGAARIIVVSRDREIGDPVITLVDGEFGNIKFIDWARTSDQIVFDARYNGRRPKDTEYHVYTVDVANGDFFTEITKGWYPTWSPDDSEIAFSTYQPQKLAIITLGGTTRTLTTTDPHNVNWRR